MLFGNSRIMVQEVPAEGVGPVYKKQALERFIGYLQTVRPDVIFQEISEDEYVTNIPDEDENDQKSAPYSSG